MLLQVVFHAQIAADDGAFDVDDVADGHRPQADPPSSRMCSATWRLPGRTKCS